MEPIKPNLPGDDDDDEFVSVGLEGLLAATSKVAAVYRGDIPPDDRDALQFKRILPLNQLLKERVRLDTSHARRRIVSLASRRRSLQHVMPLAFDAEMTGQFIGNPLASPLEEINPMQLVQEAHRATHMGPGGIGSDDAITVDMQAVRASQMGFVSPLEGPESSRAGIDVRLAAGARIGSDGKLYQRFRNRKTGKYHWLSHEQTAQTTIKLPD
jgi:DNA-directed RNA polymerase beta subunit